MSLSQNLSAVPVCAQNCLASAASATKGNCSNLDVYCLCTNENYVSSLSCCLATSCSTSDQQKAIQFDIETCATYNASAPDFVGCSPLGLNGTNIISFSTAAFTMAPSSTPSSSNPANATVSTVTGLETALTTFSGKKPVVASFTGAPLLTGTCSSPYYAEFTDLAEQTTEYPFVGCSPNQADCCPFNPTENAVITKCPQDYFTTSGACCPTGWSVYGSMLGGETPCYTVPSAALVPAMTSTLSGVTVITGHLFTRKYDLAQPKSGLSTGATAGIAIGAVLGVAAVVLALMFFFLRRRRARQAQIKAEAAAVAMANEEKGVASLKSGAQELPSPQSQPNSPRSTGQPWSAPHPSGYMFPFQEVSRFSSPQPPPVPPSELPGSFFIHEHHPAFGAGREEQELEANASPRASPKPTSPKPTSPNPRSPTISVTSPSSVISPLEGER